MKGKLFFAGGLVFALVMTGLYFHTDEKVFIVLTAFGIIHWSEKLKLTKR